MRRLSAAAVLAAAVLVLAVPAAAHAGNDKGASCALSVDAGGFLHATGSGFTAGEYQYEIYAVPSGASAGGGQLSPAAGGTLDWGSPDPVTFYLGVYPGTTGLTLSIYGLHSGLRDL